MHLRHGVLQPPPTYEQPNRPNQWRIPRSGPLGIVRNCCSDHHNPCGGVRERRHRGQSRHDAKLRRILPNIGRRSRQHRHCQWRYALLRQRGRRQSQLRHRPVLARGQGYARSGVGLQEIAEREPVPARHILCRLREHPQRQPVERRGQARGRPRHGVARRLHLVRPPDLHTGEHSPG